jgi:hypothetical protein
VTTIATGSHAATRQAIFQHPMARSLTWQDVRAMLIELADAVDEHGDLLKITRNGQTLILHRPSRKGMDDIRELMKVRHFIELTDDAAATQNPAGVHLLVVLDNRLARIYKIDMEESLPQRIIPYDQNGTGRHLHHGAEVSGSKPNSQDNRFYDAIGRTLKGAGRILIFGNTTGPGSAMDQLLLELRRQAGDQSTRVSGSVVVNARHLTESELLAEARRFYTRMVI